MIIHHAYGLHVRITDGTAEKIKPALFHILTYRIGYRRCRRHCGRIIHHTFAIGHKAIQVVVKGTKFLHDFGKSQGIFYSCDDFHPVPDNCLVLQEMLNFLFVKSSYFVKVKVCKCISVAIPSV